VNDRIDDDADPRLSTGSYSLDALTPDELEEFEHAARQSPTLRTEADELRATATLLGLAATPVEPSARLKTDLMAKLASTPQLAVTDARADAAQTVAAPPVPQLAVTPDTAAAPAAAAPATAGPAERTAAARWLQRPGTVLAAAAAAAALFVGGGLVGSALSGTGGTGGTSVVDASASQLAELTAAEDVQRKSVAVEGGGTATVVWSNELGRSAVLADGLAALPEGKVYEAWYIDADGVLPAGTFRPAASGTSWHVLDGAMNAGDAVGVTVEPAGGSETPTTDPIIVVQSA
jgi:hypothetical protein